MKTLRPLACTLFLLTLLCQCQKPATVGSETVRTNPSPAGTFAFEEWTVADIRRGFESGELTIPQLTRAYLERIARVDDAGPMLNAVIQTNPDALQIAEQLQKEWDAGQIRGPMHGIPVLLKDNIDTHDQMETTAGSRALLGSKPPRDSWVAAELRTAGAVILGKANLSEWANFRGQKSSSGWSGVGGQTHNPYRLDRNPCGSSSGSGAAVSANLAVVAIGTETNGSIVCPSSANGVVGIKPTVGLVSRSGIIPISFTQDTPGPMARTVRDAALCLGAMTGVDARDSKTAASAGKFHQDYTPFLKKDGLRGKRIGVYRGPFGILASVDSLSERAISYMESQGATLVDVDSIYDNAARSASFEVMLFEYKDGLNEYFASLGDDAPVKSVEELIAFNKKDPVELDFYQQEYLEMAQEKGDLTSQEYQDALALMARESQQNGIDRILREKNLDAIIAPTGSPAWKTDHDKGDTFHLGSSSPAAMAGYPNISVPMGFVDGLPVGLSIFGTAWSEPVLLQIAYSYEQGTQHRQAPKFLPN